MKFGKQLIAKAVPHWSRYYINYKQLKRIVKNAEQVKNPTPSPSSSSTPPPLLQSHSPSPAAAASPLPPLDDIITQFFFTLDRELEKVNYFYTLKKAKFEARATVLCGKVDAAVAASANHAPISNANLIESALRELIVSIQKMREFVKLNLAGFSKILKKFDKHLHRDVAGSYLTSKVNPSPFAAENTLSVLRTKAMDALAKLQQLTEDAMISLSLLPNAVSQAVRVMLAAVTKDNAKRLSQIVVSIFPELQPLARSPASDDLTPSSSNNFSLSPSSSTSSAIPTDGPSLSETITRLQAEERQRAADQQKRPSDALPTARPRVSISSDVSTLLAPVMIAACQNSAIKCLVQLLAFGVHVDAASDADDQTALHAASSAGNAECVRTLLAAGANVHATDVDGKTPVLCAVLSGSSECVQLLLAAGASADVVDVDGHSPFFFAICSGNLGLAKILIDAGAMLSARSPVPQGIADREQTPLLLACRYGYFDIAAVLISAGADVNDADDNGESVLHVACSANALELVESLVQNGANVHAQEKISLHTPIFNASVNGNLQCAKLLVQHGARVLITDSNGWKPLTHAMFRGQSLVADFLREQGAKEAGLLLAPTASAPLLSPPVASSPTGSALSPSSSQSDEDAVVALRRSSSKATEDAIAKAVERSYGHIFLRHRTRVDVMIGGVEDLSPIVDLFHYGSVSRDKNGNFATRNQRFGLSDAVPESASAASGDHLLSPSGSASEFASRVTPSSSSSAAGFAPPVPSAALSQTQQHELLRLSSLRLMISSNQPQSDQCVCDLPIVEPDSCWFTFYCDQVQSMQLCIDVVSQIDDSLIGRGFILPTTLGRLRGETRCAILSPTMELVGTILISFLVVKPLQHPNISVGSKTYWKMTQTLPIIGHRGAGAGGAAKLGSYRRTHIKENTLLSFITAASLGAEYVEFDVQMTRDGVPVIYHDWTVKETSYNLPVCRLDLKTFKSIYHAGIPKRLARARSYDESEAESVDELVRSVSASSPQTLAGFSSGGNSAILGGSIASFPRARRSIAHTDYQSQLEATIRFQIGDEGVAAPFPTLADAFKNTPPSIGFNIEVKYPLIEEREEYDLQMMELNNFIDRILTCVYDHAGDRPVIFSSFHPDTCIMLSLKQPNYPVFFLTSAGWNNERYTDPRCNSIYWAIHFAKSANLLGIVSQSAPFLECPELIHAVKSSGLLLLTWGRRNNEVESVQLQQKYGVDAVILDHVAHVRKGLHSSGSAPVKP